MSCAEAGSGALNSKDSETGDKDLSVFASSDTVRILASRLFASRTYEDFMESLFDPGHVVWLDASELDSSTLTEQWEQIDGVILTGGEDIHPERYLNPGGIDLCGDIDVERDEMEALLLQMVDSLRLPCLGICRGLQFMNVHGGGTLHPHLPLVLESDLHRAGVEGNSKDTTHEVMANAEAQFLGIASNAVSVVVSHHHQGIDQLASELVPWAHSPDGLVEGIRHVDTLNFPCYLGVQWHPERSARNQEHVEQVGLYFLNHMVHSQK